MNWQRAVNEKWGAFQLQRFLLNEERYWGVGKVYSTIEAALKAANSRDARRGTITFVDIANHLRESKSEARDA